MVRCRVQSQELRVCSASQVVVRPPGYEGSDSVTQPLRVPDCIGKTSGSRQKTEQVVLPEGFHKRAYPVESPTMVPKACPAAGHSKRTSNSRARIEARQRCLSCSDCSGWPRLLSDEENSQCLPGSAVKITRLFRDRALEPNTVAIGHPEGTAHKGRRSKASIPEASCGRVCSQTAPPPSQQTMSERLLHASQHQSQHKLHRSSRTKATAAGGWKRPRVCSVRRGQAQNRHRRNASASRQLRALPIRLPNPRGYQQRALMLNSRDPNSAAVSKGHLLRKDKLSKRTQGLLTQLGGHRTAGGCACGANLKPQSNPALVMEDETAKRDIQDKRPAHANHRQDRLTVRRLHVGRTSASAPNSLPTAP
jgi:hypothetical protein